MKQQVSMGIMAYNEEAIIGSLLEAVLKQEWHHGELLEIVVVASGCTDGTEKIVRSYERADERVRLLAQAEREGKASAINLFLKHASGDIVILESADTVPDEGTLDKLIAPFQNPRVGMTGAHPVPVDTTENFIGFMVRLLWRLHHKIALHKPKLGELIAFRHVIHRIPPDTAVDEASLEAIMQELGYELRYVPEAIVRNKGPETLKDMITQRRRIAAGHLYVKKTQHLTVSTSKPFSIVKVLLPEFSREMKKNMWIAGAILLEAFCRALGAYDFYLKKKNPYIWDIADSTKRWK
ncbi:hypothetical protein CSB45_04360 [candidate division KSB3 bacterium]|uniref:Glycosyltransferase 2-like domain-containing protein n=1 Tax=candidate division KSB3 bacterium TaxID=2044937 RepID=A0A2G6E8A3_9BACT|nr:MAG: hypothetical protein CSB45_04360 [candidate division KSB3 bacterium]PIE30610.1 MAG: hypothetical protein CSA57_02945 [candidate division KSB3 bacterium]